MAATTTMVHVRVDEHVKAQAAETLALMGLTVSDAIRVFLTRVVADGELPFALIYGRPQFAKHKIGDEHRGKLQPYIRILSEAFASHP